LLRDWRKELNRLLIVTFIFGCVGYFLNAMTLALLIALALYIGQNFYQLRRLHKWLSQDHINKSEPPESFGLWGDILDGIYRLQKRERKSSRKLKAIIDKAQESSAALEMAVVMVSKHSTLVWWNKAAETLLGLHFPNDQNQAVLNLIRDPRFADYFNSGSFTEPVVITSPGNKNLILEYHITLFGENERLIIVRDITQIHRLELMRKDFVGNVSHELGTPITVIKGYLENILDNADDLSEMWRNALLQMQQQSNRMENIVQDLLLLASLETKVIANHQESVNVRTLLNEIKSDTAQIFADKSHEFKIDCANEYTISADRSELYSAISNLAINAAKYTPVGGTIILSARREQDSFDIEVQDNGIGIEKHHLPRLTERFYRVDASRSSESGGTGLGLAIVKHIMVRHGANLKIISNPEKGSRFICSLPLARLIDSTEDSSGANNTHTIPDRPDIGARLH